MSTSAGDEFNLGSMAPGVSTPITFNDEGQIMVICADPSANEDDGQRDEVATSAMSIRYKLLLAFGLVFMLAASVAVYAIRAISTADDLVVQLYDQAFMATSHARAAQVRILRGARKDGAGSAAA